MDDRFGFCRRWAEHELKGGLREVARRLQQVVAMASADFAPPTAADN